MADGKENTQTDLSKAHPLLTISQIQLKAGAINASLGRRDFESALTNLEIVLGMCQDLRVAIHKHMSTGG